MLFDLRSRGRRHTIRVVYVILAVLMGGGLIGFGIGGGGALSGGLFNALTDQPKNSDKPSAHLVKQEQTLSQQVQANPQDQAALTQLARVRYQLASQGKNYNPSTNAFTEGGKAQLRGATQAWKQYLALNPRKPDPQLARLMVQAFTALNDPSGLTSTQEIVALASPTAANYAQLAIYAYAAKETRKGDLSEAKALHLAPAAQRSQLKTQLDQAKKQAAGGGGSTPGSG